MLNVVTDTHAIVWYLARSPKLSPAALQHMQAAVAAGDLLLLPTICIVEIIYLVEKGRLPTAARDRLARQFDQASSDVKLVPLDRGVAEAVGMISRDEVPDMPDRIIAATALHLGLPLITRDGRIRASGLATIW